MWWNRNISIFVQFTTQQQHELVSELIGLDKYSRLLLGAGGFFVMPCSGYGWAKCRLLREPDVPQCGHEDQTIDWWRWCQGLRAGGFFVETIELGDGESFVGDAVLADVTIPVGTSGPSNIVRPHIQRDG